MAAMVKDSPRQQKKLNETSMNGSCKGFVGSDKAGSKTVKKESDRSQSGKFQENGLEMKNEVLTDDKSFQRKGDGGFETFVMTGDMIIRTSSPQKGNKRNDNKKDSDGNGSPVQKSDSELAKLRLNGKESAVVPELEETNVSPEIPLAVSPGEISICVEGDDSSNGVDLGSKTEVPDEPCVSMESNKIGDASQVEPTAEDNQDMDHSEEVIISNDINGVNNNTEKNTEINSEEPVKARSMVISKSAEKVTSGDLQQKSLVRSSKSHENYLENTESFLMVDIEIEDKIASSVDALMYDQSNCSLERIANMNSDRSEEHISKSLESSPEHQAVDLHDDKVLVPGFICLEEARIIGKGKTKDAKDEKDDKQVLERDNNPNTSEESDDTFDEGATYEKPSGQHSNSEGATSPESDPDFLDSDSVYHQPTKDVDRPSATRLAKRLYHLDGFKKSDVSRHLSKKNDFSQLVGEEYLKYFDFTDDTLDMALRQFLSKFALTGETQERERILLHFSRRYIECNPNSYNSEDACHTLVCAIMLLNSDLHGQNIGRKMTCGEFIENLADLNDGENFPREVLKAIYNAIKTEPLSWSLDESDGDGDNSAAGIPQDKSATGANPFLEVPDPSKTKEYISGYVMRKCCQDSDGRKTPLGKRGWKMFYASLRDMILYLHKDENSCKKQGVFPLNNAIRIHHSLATKATDYVKKQHVFRLQTSDWSVFLLQTSDSKELQRWIDTINYASATLSAPPLPGACGSQRRFQRPLMPSSYTKLNLQEQLLSHEKRVDEIERELKEQRSYPPEKGAKPRIIQEFLEKESYLEFELKRFKTYAYLLQSKMAIFPELEPSLVETAIGEVEEPPSPTSSRVPEVLVTDAKPKGNTKIPLPVQRSLSDRNVDGYEEVEYRSEVSECTRL